MTTSPTSSAKWQYIIEAYDNGGNVAHKLDNRDLLAPADIFVKRHIGPRSHDPRSGSTNWPRFRRRCPVMKAAPVRR